LAAAEKGDEEAAFLFRTLIALVSCAFHGALRTGSLAPGMHFSLAKHWSWQTLQVFEKMSLDDCLEDRIAVIPPPETKTFTSSKEANERAMEGCPYELFDDLLNFPRNAQRMMICKPSNANHPPVCISIVSSAPPDQSRPLCVRFQLALVGESCKLVGWCGGSIAAAGGVPPRASNNSMAPAATPTIPLAAAAARVG
jgi:hypothetical protein